MFLIKRSNTYFKYVLNDGHAFIVLNDIQQKDGSLMKIFFFKRAQHQLCIMAYVF